MNIGILAITDGESVSDAKEIDLIGASLALNERGYFVTETIRTCRSEQIYPSFSLLKSSCDALLIVGNIESFRDIMSSRYQINRRLSALIIEDIPCALCAAPDREFIRDSVIPVLNSRCKTFYATTVFKTFGKTQEQLRERLKEYIKNRNRIVIKFVPSLMECAVHVRYSSKTAKQSVDEVIAGVTEALADCTYALSDVELGEQTANLLILRGKKLGIAESFTGGSVTAALVQTPGISSVLTKGLVCYTNQAKIDYLKVDSKIIDVYGAVSAETVYEMAAGLLMHCGCEVCVATTGNAGPTAEKEGENGVCYIAVGEPSGINLYRYVFEGDRAQVIESGKKAALFHLYKMLSESEFSRLVQTHAIDESIGDGDFPQNA